MHSFGNIFLGQRGGVVGSPHSILFEQPACGMLMAIRNVRMQSQGALRVNGSGLAWKRNAGGKAIEIKKDGGVCLLGLHCHG